MSQFDSTKQVCGRRAQGREQRQDPAPGFPARLGVNRFAAAYFPPSAVLLTFQTTSAVACGKLGRIQRNHVGDHDEHQPRNPGI